MEHIRAIRAYSLLVVLALYFGSSFSPVSALLCSDPGAPWKATPQGTNISLGGLDAYVAGPPSANQKAAIIFITDIMGWGAQSNRIAADVITQKSGIPVFIPDFFQGDSLSNYPNSSSFIGNFPPSRVIPLIHAVVSDLQSQFGDDVSLGAIGFCWGGKYSLILGAEGKTAATVACHPSRVNATADNLAQTTAPTLFNLAVGDFLFADPVKADAIAAVRGGGAITVVREFEGVRHGFCVRCEEGDSVCEAARYQALSLSSGWFATLLKKGVAKGVTGVWAQVKKFMGW